MANKKPHQQHQPSTEKIPRVESPPNRSKFTWSFLLLDKEGPFGWKHCASHEKYLEILEKKGHLEDKTLSELAYQKSHSVSITTLCKEAQQRLTELKQDDLDTLFSFRMNNKNRVWCIHQNNIMRVLWWDPDHLVCPSMKRDN